MKEEPIPVIPVLTTPALRLSVIRRASGFTSVRDLAVSAGLKDPAALSLIEGGKREISDNLARNLSRLYPLFTPQWIARGEHLRFEHVYGNKHQILLNDYEVRMLGIFRWVPSIYHADQHPEKILYLPNLLCKKAAFGYFNSTASLEPFSHKGDILLLKKTTGRITEDGLYYIETSGLIAFRYVRRIPESRSFELIGFNDRTEDIQIEEKDIRSHMQVTGVIASPCPFPLEPFISETDIKH